MRSMTVMVVCWGCFVSLLADSFSSRVRPVLKGRAGGVSAAHPLAVAAGQEMLFTGGGAVDALIAAQAVLCVVSPDACGLGGDVLALIHSPTSGTTAVNGAGAAPMALTEAAADGASSVTVPGIVDGWACMHLRCAACPWRDCWNPPFASHATGSRCRRCWRGR
jgi:gamma-glutamyltranspeptidase/glutathione hydrolase